MKSLLTRAFGSIKAKLRMTPLAALAPGGRSSTRYLLSSRYLRGEGIEIGALHTPLRVPRRARVSYVDRLRVADLRKHYQELAHVPLIEPDILDDGESLASFADESQDFVIANHFLEHCQDPIGALQNMLRVLEVGGCLYMAIPDKRYTFDKDRPVTTLSHLIQDHRMGPEWSRRAHYGEHVRFVHEVTDAEQHREDVESMMAMGYSIHFHVWTMTEVLELLTSLDRLVSYPFEVEAVVRNSEEVICILRRTGGRITPARG